MTDRAHNRVRGGTPSRDSRTKYGVFKQPAKIQFSDIQHSLPTVVDLGSKESYEPDSTASPSPTPSRSPSQARRNRYAVKTPPPASSAQQASAPGDGRPLREMNENDVQTSEEGSVRGLENVVLPFEDDRHLSPASLFPFFANCVASEGGTLHSAIYLLSALFSFPPALERSFSHVFVIGRTRLLVPLLAFVTGLAILLRFTAVQPAPEAECGFPVGPLLSPAHQQRCQQEFSPVFLSRIRALYWVVVAGGVCDVLLSLCVMILVVWRQCCPPLLSLRKRKESSRCFPLVCGRPCCWGDSWNRAKAIRKKQRLRRGSSAEESAAAAAAATQSTASGILSSVLLLPSLGASSFSVAADAGGDSAVHRSRSFAPRIGPGDGLRIADDESVRSDDATEMDNWEPRRSGRLLKRCCPRFGLSPYLGEEVLLMATLLIGGITVSHCRVFFPTPFWESLYFLFMIFAMPGVPVYAFFVLNGLYYLVFGFMCDLWIHHSVHEVHTAGMSNTVAFGETPMFFVTLQSDIYAFWNALEFMIVFFIGSFAVMQYRIVLRKFFFAECALGWRKNALMSERERTRQLLGNVLPTPILKSQLYQDDHAATGGPPRGSLWKASARDGVVLGFLEVVGFLRIAADSPVQMVNQTDRLFSYLDEQVGKNDDMVQIKTVRELYFVTAGLFPKRRRKNREEVARNQKVKVEDVAANVRTMLDFVTRVLRECPCQCILKAGVAEGPVSYGVIGTYEQPHAFDVYGIAVNRAAWLVGLAEARHCYVWDSTFCFVLDVDEFRAVACRRQRQPKGIYPDQETGADEADSKKALQMIIDLDLSPPVVVHPGDEKGSPDAGDEKPVLPPGTGFGFSDDEIDVLSDVSHQTESTVDTIDRGNALDDIIYGQHFWDRQRGAAGDANHLPFSPGGNGASSWAFQPFFDRDMVDFVKETSELLPAVDWNLEEENWAGLGAGNNRIVPMSQLDNELRKKEEVELKRMAKKPVEMVDMPFQASPPVKRMRQVRREEQRRERAKRQRRAADSASDDDESSDSSTESEVMTAVVGSAADDAVASTATALLADTIISANVKAVAETRMKLDTFEEKAALITRDFRSKCVTVLDPCCQISGRTRRMMHRGHASVHNAIVGCVGLFLWIWVLMESGLTQFADGSSISVLPEVLIWCVCTMPNLVLTVCMFLPSLRRDEPLEGVNRRSWCLYYTLSICWLCLTWASHLLHYAVDLYEVASSPADPGPLSTISVRHSCVLLLFAVYTGPHLFWKLVFIVSYSIVATVGTAVALSVRNGAPPSLSSFLSDVTVLWVVVCPVLYAIGFDLLNRSYYVSLSRFSIELHRLNAKQKEANRLLESYLPSHVLQSLYRGTKNLTAEIHGDVAILYADMVNFCGWTKSLPLLEVMGHLNSIFGAFDAMRVKLDLFRVKLVGDCYHAASNLRNQREVLHLLPHTHRMMLFGFRLLNYLKDFHKGIEFRVGIHIGVVVAGVVGKRTRFSYDIFGRDDRIAEWLEEKGTPMTVHVSGAMMDATDRATLVGCPTFEYDPLPGPLLFDGMVGRPTPIQTYKARLIWQPKHD